MKVILNPDITYFALSSADVNNTKYCYSMFLSIPKVDDKTLEAYRQEVIDLVNVERAKYNLPKLAKLDKLMEAAAIRAKEQYEKEGHTRPNNTDCFTVIKDVNFTLSVAYTLGENVANGQSTPKEVMTDWMNSEAHRRNILTPDFNYIGVGVAVIKNKMYWAQMFYKGKDTSSYK